MLLGMHISSTDHSYQRDGIQYRVPEHGLSTFSAASPPVSHSCVWLPWPVQLPWPEQLSLLSVHFLEP